MNESDDTTAELDGIAARFNARREVRWFGLHGSLDPDGLARVSFLRYDDGVLGGGGTDAINGGVIAAGFDAVCVLAGLAGWCTDRVVTLTLNVHFLRLARRSPGLAFRARVAKRSRSICFIDAELVDLQGASPHNACATAHATLAPMAVDRAAPGSAPRIRPDIDASG